MVESPPRSSSGASILVVDDEPLVLKMIRAVLSSRGHRVITAERGRDAQRLLEVEQVDVLIADLCLPDLNGVDLLAEARRRHPHVRRIAFSGANDVTLAKRCVNDGEVHRYLTKPCGAEELLAAIDDAVGTRREGVSGEQLKSVDRCKVSYVLTERRLDVLRRVFAGTALEPLAELAPGSTPTTDATVAWSVTTITRPQDDEQEK